MAARSAPVRVGPVGGSALSYRVFRTIGVVVEFILVGVKVVAPHLRHADLQQARAPQPPAHLVLVEIILRLAAFREGVSAVVVVELAEPQVAAQPEIAGIQGGKKTSELIPLCHPLQITKIDVSAKLTDDGVEVRSEARCVGKTGIEMEALTAVNIALLTVYDMCKAVDKEMIIGEISLIEKTKTDLD